MEQEREKVLHFCCPNCGGTVKWNISKQQLECTSCRTLFFPNAGYAPVREHDYASYPEQEQQQVSVPEQTAMALIKNQPSSFAFMLLSFTNGSDQKRES